MIKKTLYLFLAAAIILVGTWYVLGRTSKFETRQPDLTTPPLPQLPPYTTAITVPVHVPIEVVRRAFEHHIPKRHSDTKRKRVIDEWYLTVSATTSWAVKRSTLVVAADDNLHLSSNFSGEAKLDVSKIKGLLRVKLHAPLSLAAKPIINTDWRMHIPNLKLQAKLKTAKVRFFGVWFSVRGLAQPELDKMMSRTSKKLRTIVANNDFLEAAAKKYWQKLCRSYPLDKESELWLNVKPLSAQVAQPIIAEGNIRLQLGLIAETRVSTKASELNCPFPQALTIAVPRKGRVEVALPAEIDYSALQIGLERNVVGKKFGEDITVTVDGVSVHPHGDALLLKTQVSVNTAGWFGKRAEGTLYLLATPSLDTEMQVIKFKDIELDISSRNALLAIVGEAVEPILLDAIESRASFDLKPILDGDLKDKANAAIGSFTSSEVALEGHVDEIRINYLAVGPVYLQLVGTALGRVDAAIHTIAEFER